MLASLPPTSPTAERRLTTIAAARARVLDGGALPDAAAGAIEPWIERSWRRCLAQGFEPSRRVAFDTVSRAVLRQTLEANHALIEAARPALERLSEAMARTRYFALLTNAQGIVVDTHGPIDARDPRAAAITRIGADLSEAAVGTTAIGAALIEQHPVWLHRGEHFFEDTSVYSCAGAPLFGPDGRCLGMLDLTGIDAVERPELRHLVARTARGIENALALRQPHALLLRLNWPGQTLGSDDDGLVCLDADGRVTAANSTARTLLPLLGSEPDAHAETLFATPLSALFDAARRHKAALDLPLWSGLRLQGWVHAREHGAGTPTPAAGEAENLSLKDLELHLIRKAVADARGNVQQAARTLGISRATVYRKLGRRI